MTFFVNVNSENFDKEFKAFLSKKRENEKDVSDVVSNIINDVRDNGDKALFEYTKKFDKLDLNKDTVKVSREEIDNAIKQCDKDVLDALYLAAERIEAFHNGQMPENKVYQDENDMLLGWRWTPVQSVGLYVPGGTAAYPSSVLMNAVPAKVAGVKRIVMVVPSPNGQLNPLVLAAADCVGVDEIYKVGGAQAIAALAYGTESIDKVDLITGPGNAYVAAAKRQVFGRVGIDMIAGPSEIMVVADKTANLKWLAADLLSQSEHDASAQSILVTDSKEIFENINAEVEAQLEKLERKDIAKAAWENNGAVFFVDDVMKDAGYLVDQVAPEHLELVVKEPEELSRYIHNAGAIFLGDLTPEAIGDYVGGPNHVLPTARSAKFSSGLGVQTFMKRTTLLKCSKKALKQIGNAAVLLGNAEGLGAHANSVKVRLD
ncbi:MAG: histidinol dehydrogenase [Alphaproteobacteria bacterium]|nr:histidinol dehydrogenase [Alphaproteobacteria bacterium]